jgi:hypothetical protein
MATSCFYWVCEPNEYRIAGPGMDARLYNPLTAGLGWHPSTIALGIAERAFEIVLEYTENRMGDLSPSIPKSCLFCLRASHTRGSFISDF